ncbi:MAG: hypothetical protein RIG68_20885 [Imperialibacter sp.]|jgi:hypothetical protein|uniref:hypothetical protein n=1 Tax=Imperialibacter sp. TaxID=2038411 RepID=UPI0032EEF728
MKTSMLEYFKIILGKVSFDRKLLRKEYRKSLARLSKGEAKELKDWAKNNGLILARQS